MWLTLLQTHSAFAILAAYVAGFTSFFASCLLPLIPVYLAYLIGIGLEITNELKRLGSKKILWEADLSLISLFFVAGFIGMFCALSVIGSRETLVLASYRLRLDRLGGLYLMIVGLFIIGFWRHPLLEKNWRLPLQALFKNHEMAAATLAGTALALGWTACIGPIQAQILFWITQPATIIFGLGLLLAFAFGVGTPFLISGFIIDKGLPHLRPWIKFDRQLKVVCGLILVLSGFLLINNQWGRLVGAIIDHLRLNSLTL